MDHITPNLLVRYRITLQLGLELDWLQKVDSGGAAGVISCSGLHMPFSQVKLMLTKNRQRGNEIALEGSKKLMKAV